MGCAVAVQSKNKFHDTCLVSPRLKQMDKGQFASELQKLVRKESIRVAQATTAETQEYNLSFLSINRITSNGSEGRRVWREEDVKVEKDRMLFTLDLASFKLHYLSLNTMTWHCNDLKMAEVDTPLLGPSKVSRSFMKILPMLTAEFLNRASMRFIGANHFEYDVEKNAFYKRPQMNTSTCNPLLTFSESTIYAISGQTPDSSEASTNFEAYDLKTGTWSTLPNLPIPHFKGSCLYSNYNHSVIVLGGYGSLNPETFNPSVSIFDTRLQKWRRIPLEEMSIRIPKLLNTQLIEYKEQKLLVFGTDCHCKYLKMNLKLKKLTVKGNICSESHSTTATGIRVKKDPDSQEIFALISSNSIEEKSDEEQLGVGDVLCSKHPYNKWGAMKVGVRMDIS